jgi:hypothetical protein
MAGRRALVIGSQCGGLPNLRLTFLPDVAEKLFEVLVDPARGGCDADASVLIIDPELSSLARALESAVAGADAAQATLLVAFIGHAEAVGTDLYLLPANGSSPPSMFTGFLFGQGMAELVRRYSGLDGLIILVDACQSEVGVGDLAQRAASEISAAGMRVQLVSSTFDQAAMDGCFTRSLTRVLSEGVAAHSADYLVAEDVLGGIAALCTAQEEPRAMTIQGRWRVNDPGLFLGWNPAAKAAWFLTGTATGGQAVELTRDFQITDALDQAVRAWRSHQIVFLSGDPGSGKSTLVAALTRPEVAPDIISPGFMAAVVFAETSPDVMAIAEGLAAQLTRMEGFARATEQYRVWVGQDELSQQDPLTRLVVGPLRQMTVTGARRVRLAFDGLDMLDASARDAVFGAVRDLVGDPNLVGVRVLLAGRAGSVPRLSPAQTTVEVMRSPSPEEVRGYLRQRNVAHEAIPGILNNTGSWLDARLYADLAASFQASEGGSAELPGAHVDNSYSQALAAARSRGESAPLFDAVLAVLAAAGSGPVMPLGLLRDALQVAGWDVTESAVRDLLVQLGGLVARAKPGSSDEMVGLVHDTLREYLTTTSTSRGEAAGRGREAILTALDRDSGSPTPRFLEYGRTAKAELLWAVGRNGDALDWVLDSLGPREADNVVILQPWVARCTEVLGPDHLYSLAIRHHLAKHTGSAGELERARGLLTAMRLSSCRV